MATYRIPVKKIDSHAALERFVNGPTALEFVGWLEKLNESVKGLTNDAPVNSSPAIERLLLGFRRLSQLVDEVPPLPQAMRYGNKAFQTWLDRQDALADELHREMLPENVHAAIIELKPYWLESWGNRIRIDYGTGHETNFMAWLFCLEKLGLWGADQHSTVILKVFLGYLALMRKIQKTYMLEPAGSHGVWSLDDYHFLPFYFGSSQLRGHPHIKPASVRNKDIYNTYAEKFIYLGMIKFINDVKTGPFFEHSQILDSIANTVHWEKVNTGMMKMYKGEVLGKLPVMQHFLFGSLISFDG